MSNPVPEGWSLDCLGNQVGKITSGGTPKAGNPEYYGGDIPFLKIDDITSVSGMYVQKSKQSITEKAIKESSAKVFPSGTVVTTMYGTIGATAILAKPMATNQAIAAFLDLKGFSASYLQQLLTYEAERLAASASQTTQANISGTVLKEYQVLFPPLPEQQKIAAILSTVDDVIEKTRAQIDKLKDLKTGMMQELLTKGIGHTEFKDSPVGRIPVGWDARALGDLVTIKHGYAFEGEYFKSYKTPYILLTPGNFNRDGRLYFGSKTKYYEGPVPEDYVLSNGDVLVVMTDLTKEMTILGNTILLKSSSTVLHNQRIGKVLPQKEDDLMSEYLCIVMNSDRVKSHIKDTATGTTVRHTSPSKILESLVPIPPLNEQKAIVELVDSLDLKLRFSEAKLAGSENLKKALMQDLLTGKVRVNVDDKESAVA